MGLLIRIRMCAGPLIWPQVVSWWASWGYLLWSLLWRMLRSCFVGGFSSVKSSRLLLPVSLEVEPGCTIVSWLLLPCLCIPSFPWLATVWKASMPRSPTGSGLVSMPVILDEWSTFLQYDCILTNYICNNSTPNNSHFEILGIRTPTYLFTGHNSTHNNW